MVRLIPTMPVQVLRGGVPLVSIGLFDLSRTLRTVTLKVRVGVSGRLDSTTAWVRAS